MAGRLRVGLNIPTLRIAGSHVRVHPMALLHPDRVADTRERAEVECRAMRRVRDEMGRRNLKLMVPFCRTVQEGHRVLEELARDGLKRGDRGLEVYVMCEIPSNVLLA